MEIGELVKFLNDRCVTTSANLPLASFMKALRDWLPVGTPFVSISEMEDMLITTGRFRTSQVGGRLVVIGCAIPDVQRDMGSS